jgi:single-strand DNA-binding protein
VGRTASRGETATQTATEHRNEVVVVGRVTTVPTDRELPSGDEITTWRVTVDRPAGGRDVIDCTAWTARVRRGVAAGERGDVVEVSGALRRRFFTAGGAPASRSEVEVSRARRLTPATRRRTRE